MSREIFCEDVTFDNGEIYCSDVTLGQTVVVKEGPEKYTPVPITPSEFQQTIPTKDKQLTADVVVEPIPSEYIIPTGTKEITVTENGEQTINVSGFALAHILTSVSTPQGGLEYEQGTYEPTTDAESPVIYFTNQHDKAPSIIVFADVSDSLVGAGNKMTMFIYADFESMFGKPMLYTRTVKRSKFYVFSRLTGSGAVGTTAGGYNTDDVTQSSFTLYDGSDPTVYAWARTGQTYKWIAIWT